MQFRLLSVLSTVVWGSAAFIVFLFFVTSLSTQAGRLPFKLFVTTSGSMEPTIRTGDLIIVSPQPSYAVQDVVTFKDAEQRTITHRIIDAQAAVTPAIFTTQGDNNTSPDPDPVLQNQIVGKWVGTLPFMGYLLVYSRTPIGLSILIGIPLATYALELLLKKNNVPKPAGTLNEL